MFMPGLILPRYNLQLGAGPFSVDFTALTQAELQDYVDVASASNRFRVTDAGALEAMGTTEARLQHTAGGTVRGLLVEAGGTNLYSDVTDFAAATWEKNLVSITSDDITGPDGSANGDKWVETGTGTHEVVEFVALSGAPTRAILSMYATPDERDSVEFVLFGNGYVAASVDFSDASTFGNGNDGGGEFTDLQIGGETYSNGWCRNWMAIDCNTTGSTANLGLAVKLYSGAGGGSTSYAATAGAGLHAWGIMIEEVATGVDEPTTFTTGARGAEVATISTTTAGASNGDTLRLTDEGDATTDVVFTGGVATIPAGVWKSAEVV